MPSKASVTQLQTESQQREAEMRQPANAAVLNQAQFLNNLFLRKAFSWTAVMIDLEHVPARRRAGPEHRSRRRQRRQCLRPPAYPRAP